MWLRSIFEENEELEKPERFKQDEDDRSELEGISLSSTQHTGTASTGACVYWSPSHN